MMDILFWVGAGAVMGAMIGIITVTIRRWNQGA